MAQVVVEMSGDEAKLFRSYQRIIDQAAKLDQKHKEVKKSSQEAGQQADQSFGANALTTISRYAAGMIAIGTATRTVGAMMAFTKENTDAAIRSVERLIATRGQLQQVAEGRGGVDSQRLNRLADQLAMRGIDRGAAREIVFSAVSEGYVGQEANVARLIAANQFAAADVRTFAGQIPGIFDRAITPMQGIAGGAIGAKVSRLTAAEYAAVLPKAAQAGGISGAAPAETMALAAVLATRSDRASEYMATFAGQLAFGTAAKQFAGKGVVGAVEQLQAMPESRRRELLGTGKEANLIYDWVRKDMNRIKEVTTMTQQAMADTSGFVAGVEAMAFDPTTLEGRIMGARRESIVATNRREIAQEARLAAGGYQRGAARTRAAGRWVEQGGNAWSAYVSDWIAKGMEAMGAPPTMIEATTSPWSPQSVADILLNIERNTRANSGAQRAAANAMPE